VAEEIIFGPDKVTTGAANDIERASAMARSMVTRFGMSEELGMMAVGDADHEIFLGREIVQRREISEHTSQIVDREIRRIVGEAYDRARELLDGERDLLDRLAEALLERETLGRDDVDALADGRLLPAMEVEPERLPVSTAKPAEPLTGTSEEEKDDQGANRPG
jgi:cell division protease FtsH